MDSSLNGAKPGFAPAAPTGRHPRRFMSDLVLRFFLVFLLALPVYAAVRALYLRWKKPVTSKAREVVLGLFAAFMAALAALVFQPGEAYYAPGHPVYTASERIASRADINLVPFYTIRRFFDEGLGLRFVVNIIANVLMFSPFGLCLPLLWRRWQHALRVLGAGLLYSASIETVQLFIGRSVDIDDVILNVSGVALGYLLYKLLSKALPKKTAALGQPP